MGTLEITIQRRAENGWPVVAEQSEPGVFLPIRVESTLQLDTVELLSQLSPERYGMVLGRALFRDEVRDAFVRARAETEDELHILLVVEDLALRKLRWERLCAPLEGGWRLLALDQRLPFSLYLPSLTDRRFPPIGRRDLRALIVAASPADLDQYGLAPFDAAGAMADVRTALAEIPATALTTATLPLGLSTLDALCEQLTAERYTVLHLVCHGSLTDDGETVVYLEGPDGLTDPVTAARLLDRLANLRGERGLPHLVFLSSCETAVARADGTFGSLGQRLVRDLGIPAVLAMTDAVSVETARALAGPFYRRLREHGKVDRALVEACAGLAERHDVTVPALFSRLGGRPLFSDTLDRKLEESDIAFGLERLSVLVEERAPVLRERVAAGATVLQRTLETPVADLSPATRSEREAALADVNTLCQETADLSFHALAFGQEPPPYDRRCPFRGLYPFRPEDRAFFFGREALVEKLRDRLAEHSFLAVLGASGSGKSSLVLAGLLPAIQANEPGLQVAYLTPGAEPLARLEASLAAIGDRPAIVVVDQLEELFTLADDREQRGAFLARLVEIARQRRLVLTMRADFWDECAGFGAFTEAMQNHQELIAPMAAAELRAAMELQAKAVGLRFEAGLSDIILDDVRYEPGAMPLLQHALLELWNRRHGRWLRIEEYRAIGGLQQAIADTAESVYEQLDDEDRARVRTIFLRLTRLDEEALHGEGARDTRRRVRVADLVPEQTSLEATRALLARLASARLLVTRQDATTGQEEAEVAHEALIRHWPRLQGWLAEDRDFLLWRQRLGADLADWYLNKRDEGCLLRGAALVTAERWLADRSGALNAEESGFIRASCDLRQREQQALEQSRRRVTSALVAGLVIALSLFALAALQWQRAEEQHQAAERQRTVALSRQLAAQTLAHLDDHFDLAVLLSLEANRLDANVEAQGSLIYGLTTNPGLRTYLRNAAQPDRPVSRLAFSPDGRTLASASPYDQVTLWDLAQGAPLAGLPIGFAGEVRSVAFSPDGATLAAGACRESDADSCQEGMILRWDFRQRQPVPLPPLLSGYPRPINQLAFRPQPDPSRPAVLAAGAPTGEVLLFDLEQGGQVGGFTIGRNAEVQSLTFSPDGRLLAAASKDGQLVLWDLDQGQDLRRLTLEHANELRSLAFSPAPDSPLLASGSLDHTVAFWDWASGQPADLKLRYKSSQFETIAISPDPERPILAAGTREHLILLWDLSTGQQIGEPLVGHADRVLNLAFHRPADGRGLTLASAGQDGAIILWDVSARLQFNAPTVAHQGTVNSLAFCPPGPACPGGQLLVTGGEDGRLLLWDLARGQRQELASSPSDARPGTSVRGVAFSPDGRLLATTTCQRRSVSDCEGGEIRLWDVMNRRLLGSPLLAHSRPIKRLEFSLPDARYLASGSRDGTVKLWDLSLWGRPGLQPSFEFATHPGCLSPAAGDASARASTLNPVFGLAFSPDGGTLVASTRDREVFLWEQWSGAARCQTLGSPKSPVESIVFYGPRQIAWTDATIVTLWDLDRPDPRLLRDHRSGIQSLAASAAGATLASGDIDSVILWDVKDGKPLGRSFAVPGWAQSVAFSADGAMLAAGARDGSLTVWNGVRPWQTPSEFQTSWLTPACRMVARSLNREEWTRYLPGEPYRLTCPAHP